MRASAEPVPGRRERQRARTRERVFRAAVEEFRRVGAAAAQIDRIAAGAGVVRGTFYFHFPTKGHVLLELESRLEGRVAERVGGLPADTPLRAVLETAIGCVLAMNAEVADPRLMRDMLSVHVREPLEPEGAAPSHPLLGALIRAFGRARERGELRGGLSAERLAFAFLTSLFGFLIVAADSGEALREELAAFIDVFLSGVSP